MNYLAMVVLTPCLEFRRQTHSTKLLVLEIK